jgi:hypothetical protein
MKINKILVLVNLDIDEKGELRQLILSDEENKLLEQLLIKGAICKELRVLETPVESIILSKA